MRVQTVMTEDPIWLDFRATTGEAARKLSDKRVHHLPVLKEGVVIGMISERDLRDAVPDISVTRVMSDHPVTVTPDTDLKDVADRMIEQHIGAVIVVDPESSRLVGIVSYVDVLRCVREALWG
ncbi:MAG: CBS domain-containing protein [Polyangiaceae bacterium]|nr:CBS domain-containing protein [Polyangiaceae bacterium]MCL4752994.1 CBS domain-containing protein [Myxococcales bacterium]